MRTLTSFIAVLLFVSPVSAYEQCSADFDGDGDVDAADLAELLSQWGPCPFCGDGNVDPGETCDPPDPGGACDQNCQSICSPDAGSCCHSSGVPGCDNPACCECICSLSSICCGGEGGVWDFICAQEASSPASAWVVECLECNGVDYSCCVAHPPAAGCDNVFCEVVVCITHAMGDCCSVAWDDSCATLANEVCGVCQ